MKTYDTHTLEQLAPGTTLSITGASKLSGMNISEVSRLVSSGRIKSFPQPGKAKAEIEVSEFLAIVRMKNSRARIAAARALKKEKKKGKTTRGKNTSPERVVVGIFDEAVRRKPDGVEIPESADTIGDLITIAEASARVEKSTERAMEIHTWIEWMETL